MNMRLFISINFDPGAVGEFVAAREALRRWAGRGSFARGENLHLTLAFLGEQPEGRLAQVRDAMLAAAGGARAFTLRFERAGRFRREEGDIWWLAPADCPELFRLQEVLAAELEARGFPLEKRRFSPHLTLARRVRDEGSPGALLPAPVDCRVRDIRLMLSERPEGRLTYTELFRAPFPR